jgi:putative DeoR family transcriptional regulator (stage III sporulation protein D)
MHQTQNGGERMKGDPDERALALGEFVVETGATVRKAAQTFGISKSTVHKDLTVRLARRDRGLYEAVRRVLGINKSERHLRGGAATRQKYHPEAQN